MSDPVSCCIKCNSEAKDCCHTPHVIFIGISEAIKIHQEMGLKYSDFLIYTKFDDVQFEEAFSELVPTGKIIALIMRPPNRECIFFTEHGCSIPNCKPFICQVFPFWYDQDIFKEEGRIELILEERDCRLRDKILTFKTIEEACLFTGITRYQLKQIFRDAFEHYRMANIFQDLFENYSIDDAFEMIENQLFLQKQYTPPSITKRVNISAK